MIESHNYKTEIQSPATASSPLFPRYLTSWRLVQMAVQNPNIVMRSAFPVAEANIPAIHSLSLSSFFRTGNRGVPLLRVYALERNSSGGSSSDGKNKAVGVPSSNYVVPLDKSSCITRPLAEILRDLNKRIPDNIIKPDSNFIPWFLLALFSHSFSSSDWM